MTARKFIITRPSFNYNGRFFRDLLNTADNAARGGRKARATQQQPASGNAVVEISARGRSARRSRRRQGSRAREQRRGLPGPHLQGREGGAWARTFETEKGAPGPAPSGQRRRLGPHLLKIKGRANGPLPATARGEQLAQSARSWMGISAAPWAAGCRMSAGGVGSRKRTGRESPVSVLHLLRVESVALPLEGGAVRHVHRAGAGGLHDGRGGRERVIGNKEGFS
jgi:hypothetical protein